MSGDSWLVAVEENNSHFTPGSSSRLLITAGTGRPVLLGVTERLEYVDVPGHVEDLKRYQARGYAMAGNRIAIATDHPADLVEVHPPSRGKVDLGGLTVERCPPVPATGI